MNISLTFNEISFTPVTHQNSLWIRAVELAHALGYKRPDILTKLYTQNADEFTPDMTQVIEIVDNTESVFPVKARIFSLRGCHLLAMFARTPVAKAFRKWVLDVLDRLAAEERAALPEVPHIKITPSTTASRKPLEKLLKVWAAQSGISVAQCWTMVNSAFNLQSITELPEEWIPDAIAWVQGKIDEQRKALPPCPGSNLEQSRPTPAPIWNSAAAPALAITDDIDGHFAAIREHIRQINNHEEAIFQAVRKGMPPLRGTGPRSSLALLIHRNMENAGWSLHYALKSMQASARAALATGRI